MATVTSKDGTTIAYETMGMGEPLILVDGAMCYRDSGPMRPLAEALKDHFTVLIYDRRGRGESGDTLPYAIDREVEDIEALLWAVGGSAYLYGCSSGGALALEAASRLPGVKKLMIYEAPFIVDASRDPLGDSYLERIKALVAADRRSDAVKLFMKMVGMPGFLIFIMPFMGKVWPKLTGIAHTLPYDLTITTPYQQGKPLPAGRWNEVTAPVLVADGGKSPAWMRNAQAALARNLNADYRTLPGQTHMVRADAQAPVIIGFFRGVSSSAVAA
jgi:pimeloyl-ACP methyl ester carboxylesterase